MQKIGTREVAAASMLGALSALWEVIPGPPFDVPFPLYPKISWDLTGIPIVISMLFYGPLCSVYTCFIGCSIIFLRGNLPGGTLKLIAELATLLGLMLLRRHIVFNSTIAVISRVVTMTIANYYLLPFFYPIPVSTVVGLLIPIALFNLSQALINIIPAYLIHLRVVRVRE